MQSNIIPADDKPRETAIPTELDEIHHTLLMDEFGELLAFHDFPDQIDGTDLPPAEIEDYSSLSLEAQTGICRSIRDDLCHLGRFTEGVDHSGDTEPRIAEIPDELRDIHRSLKLEAMFTGTELQIVLARPDLADETDPAYKLTEEYGFLEVADQIAVCTMLRNAMARLVKLQ